MKIRKVGDVLFREYEGGDPDDVGNADDDGEALSCAWCEAGSHTDFGDDIGVIFFENDQGKVRRVEGWHEQGQLVLHCMPSSLVAATIEAVED